MTPLEQIQQVNPVHRLKLVDLLRQREEEFIRIWQCEQELREILPECPLPPPPDLPSRHKPIRKTTRKPVESTHRQILRDLLAPRENAYRIQFLYKGEKQESFQTDRKTLENLLALTSDDFRPLAIQTVFFRSLQDITPLETIWNADAHGGP